MRKLIVLAPLWMLCACAAPPPEEEPGTDAGEIVDAAPAYTCELGTIYPDDSVIDADNPVYSDSMWTQQEVSSAFAQAKANNDIAYRAYKAAAAFPDLVECAFCPCGCDVQVNHRSAVDCFKDMHGFS